MIAFEDIRDVHLEISTLCNASCPWCPRTFWGYPHNGGYPELNFSLDSAKKIFAPEFLKQLSSIMINGNYGDIVMNPEGPDIVEYLRSQSLQLDISINTNGSARDDEFWKRLAYTKAKLIFAIDGLADTHHLYRQNTQWKQVIKNAETVISAGGYAVWKMIQFDHNRQQIEQCRQLSLEMGFKDFILIDHGRDTAPVFDRHGNFTHVIGNYTGETDFKILFYKKQNDEILLEDVVAERVPAKSVACQTQKRKSIYIAANGDVSPCCWMGLYPKTYGKGQYHQAANQQISDLIRENNALEYPLEHCIKWFSEIERAWNQKFYEQGRLIICDDNCGQCDSKKP